MQALINFFVGGSVSTVILAAALWLLSDEGNNPFKEDGNGVTWGKCAALAFGSHLLLIGLIIFGALILGAFGILLGLLLTIVAWFMGIMVLFDRTFLQAILFTIAVWGLSALLGLFMGAF
ncbi:MAG: hypothetical protein H8E44_09530 [Planctomycetes bacterium]|nr:hypothetical protein [Planctomycetota bacterium]MBL7040472.1 hypothetical protein [Pirellulaceae bacterium]